MTDETIDDLNPAGTLTGAENVAINQAGITVRTNITGLTSFAVAAATAAAATYAAAAAASAADAATAKRQNILWDALNEYTAAHPTIAGNAWFSNPQPTAFDTTGAYIGRQTPVVIGTAGTLQDKNYPISAVPVKTGDVLFVTIETNMASGATINASFRDAGGSVVGGANVTSGSIASGLQQTTIQITVPALATAAQFKLRVTPSGSDVPVIGGYCTGIGGAASFSAAPCPKSLQQYVFSLDTGVANRWWDPFFEVVQNRPLLGFETAQNFFGTLVPTSANSPWGKGSVMNTGSGVTAQSKRTISDLGFKIGDILGARVAAYFATVAGSATLFFRDSTGSVIGSGISAGVAAIGLNDLVFPLTAIPSNTISIEMRATSGSDPAATAEIVGVATGSGGVPAYGYVPLPENLRPLVAQGRNLFPDPFKRQYSAGVKFQDGWAFAQTAGVSTPAVVTTSSNSPFPLQNVIRIPTGAGSTDINVSARRLPLKVGATVTVVLGIYTNQQVNLAFFGRTAADSVLGSATNASYTWLAAGYQEIRKTLTVDATMASTAAYFQIRVMNGLTVGASPVDICGIGLYTDNEWPILFDDCYGDDMEAIERALRPSFGLSTLREAHKRITELRMSASSQAVLALIGDSYTHLPARYSQPLATRLQADFGNAGIGFLGFGNPASGVGNINGTAWQGITITTAGTWASAYATGFGPDICSVTATGTGNIYKISGIPAGVSAINLLAEAVTSSSVDYSWDDGATWTNINTSAGSGGIVVAAIGSIPGGGGNLWFRASTGSPILYGADVQSTTSGIRVHKLGATGSSAAQWAANVVDARWQTAIQALNPRIVAVMLAANDQGASTSPQVYEGYLSTILTTIQATLPYADILVLMQPENQRANNVAMGQYESVARALTAHMGLAYHNLQSDYGINANDYIYSGSRPWFASDLLHPDPTNNGGYPIMDAVYRALAYAA